MSPEQDGRWTVWTCIFWVSRKEALLFSVEQNRLFTLSANVKRLPNQATGGKGHMLEAGQTSQSPCPLFERAA